MKHLINIFGAFLMLISQGVNAQKISMNFPAYAGKTYDFVLFKGNKTNVLTGTIPSDGKFVLEIPIELSPYHGMSRWLITNTTEGGGLDMIIPGKDFSVECLVEKPLQKDIIYKGNDENKTLDSIFSIQKMIIEKYSIMSKALKIYSKTDKNYNIYNDEYSQQLINHDVFLESLIHSNRYADQFLMINNLTTGVGMSRLTADESVKGKEAGKYITENMDWRILYTSGYWDTVIKAWVDIQTTALDQTALQKNFVTIGNKLKSPEMYTSYVERVTHYLTTLGKDDIIEKLTSTILSSKKMANYDGVLSVYKNMITGSHAPD